MATRDALVFNASAARLEAKTNPLQAKLLKLWDVVIRVLAQQAMAIVSPSGKFQ